MNSAQDELRPDEKLAKALSVSKDFFIFPCKVLDKSPYILGGFKAATQDEAQIRKWWVSWPKALVGVPTGSTNGLVVIDYDPENDRGDASGWIQNHSEALISTQVNDTRREGGKHYIYSTAHAYQSGSHVVLDGIKRHGLDIRADGGYVIWWPAEGKHTQGEIQPLPAGLLDKPLNTNTKSAVSAPQTGSTSDWSRDRELILVALPFTDAADRDIWVKVGQAIHLASSGSEDGFEIWHRWSAGGDAGPPASYESESDCRYHWLTFNQNINGKQLVTLGTVFDLARKGGWQKGYGEAERNPLRSGEAERNPIRIRSAAEIVKDRTQPQWLLRPYLERNIVGIMYGDLGTYKSFLALHWCLLLAMEGKPTLYFNAEGRGMAKRLNGWAHHHYPASAPDDFFKNLPFSAVEVPLDLSSDRVIELVIEAIDAGGVSPALVVIDTLSKYAGPLDVDKGVDARIMLERAGRIRLQYAAAVVIVGHTGHMVKDRARGSYDLQASTEANWRVERNTKELVVTTGRLKDSESPPPFAMMGTEVDCGTLDFEGGPETSLVLVPTELSAAASKSRFVGKNQERGLAAINEWARANPNSTHISSSDLTAVLNTQTIGRRRRAEVMPFLVNYGVLTPAVAGHTLNRGAL